MTGTTIVISLPPPGSLAASSSKARWTWGGALGAGEGEDELGLAPLARHHQGGLGGDGAVLGDAYIGELSVELGPKLRPRQGGGRKANCAELAQGGCGPPG